MGTPLHLTFSWIAAGRPRFSAAKKYKTFRGVPNPRTRSHSFLREEEGSGPRLRDGSIAQAFPLKLNVVGARLDGEGRSTARPQHQLELEASVGVVELVAEQLAELGDAVAGSLRVDLELRGHRDGVAVVADVG